MASIELIKEWLNKMPKTEIRMGLAQAKDMGIIFDDNFIVNLFKEGIAVDVVIKQVGDNDLLPIRLQKNFKNKNLDFDNGFIRLKIVDKLNTKVLNPLEIAIVLFGKLQGNLKVASQLTGSEDDFIKIRIIDNKKNKILSLKEIDDIFTETLSGDYEYFIEKV